MMALLMAELAPVSMLIEHVREAMSLYEINPTESSSDKLRSSLSLLQTKLTMEAEHMSATEFAEKIGDVKAAHDLINTDKN